LTVVDLPGRVASMDINELVEKEVRSRLAAELKRMLAQVERPGAPGPGTKHQGGRAGAATSASTTKTRKKRKVTEVVREQLARGPQSFGQLWGAVERTGGTKFALKSALGKGRERGEFFYNGDEYSLMKDAGKLIGGAKLPKHLTHPKKKKPLPVSTRKGSAQENGAATSS
jgi:hypothetical protein